MASKANGMNIQIVAGRVKRVQQREIEDKRLTSIWIGGYPFAVLVWHVGDEEAPALQEGDFLFAEGRVQTRSYEHEGEKRYVTEVIAHRLANLSDGKAGNAVFAIGNLGRDPSMRRTSTGKAVTEVSLAANAFGVERPEWFNLTAWEKVAEVIHDYLHKGDRIAVAGRLLRSTWKGKDEQADKTFHRTKLVVGDLLMLGGASSSGHGDTGREEEDEIPF